MDRSGVRENLVLAGDIGGTKTDLGLFVKGNGRARVKATETFSCREFRDLEGIIGRFLELHPVAVKAACFGVAGPVISGRCRTTNLPWGVSEHRLRNRFQWSRVVLINDLTAMARAVPVLQRRELFSLNRGATSKGGTIALVAPGTGLGQALLIRHGTRYVTVPSEGGHADFAAKGGAEQALLEYLTKRFGHVSVERVLSGPGLLNIYAWLRDSGRFKESAWLVRLLNEMDPARAVSESALQGRSRLCSEALDMFITIFGAVSGNLALTAMTTGGVYLGGGISPKILPGLKDGRFMKAFADKGRFSDFMKKIPVRVILNEKAALLGAAQTALELL